MAGRGRGRGRKRIRLSPAEQQPEAKLPEDLLREIISRVTLRDNIRASAVCKRWLAAAISVRNVDKPPLLMIPKKGNLYEFCDPSRRKSFELELPELQDSVVCCAKDGWLLLQKLNDQVLFFFSPYTRDLIILPFKKICRAAVTFSAAPTSHNCILTAIDRVGKKDIAVSMFRLGQSTEWTTISYETGQFFTDSWNKLCFSKGLFYCFSDSALYVIFDPDTVTLEVHPMPGPLHRIFFMAEHDGDFFAIYPASAMNPKIYKFDCTKKVWSKRKNLGGITLFGNIVSSLCRTNLRKMRDRVYLSKVYSRKNCLSYSFDDGTYYPENEVFNWEYKELSTNIWMEWPENPPLFR